MSPAARRRPYSLSRRMLATQSLVLVAFILLTAATLDHLFRSSATDAIEDRLDLHILTLLAVAELDEEWGLTMPLSLPEPRFRNPAGGLYAFIHSRAGETLWNSGSAVGMEPPDIRDLAPGQRVFRKVEADTGPLFQRSLGVRWESLDGSTRELVFTVYESMDDHLEQLAVWRQQMLVWFGVAMALLLAVQMLSLRLMLRPLKRVESEIRDVETGERDQLSTNYPAELDGVADNLNALVASERLRARRYRETLDNLAHSLKTPLAAVRSALSGSGVDDEHRRAIEEQVEAVDRIVAYQLRRASAGRGGRIGRAPIPVAPVAARVRDALARVYASRGTAIELDVEEAAVFPGDEGDLMEILGNLLDNACKYGDGHVRLSAAIGGGATREDDGRSLLVEVADDGVGIPAEQAEAALMRGKRLDESLPGAGIGLAVVKELVEAMDGSIEVGASERGGAAIRLRIPLA